MDTPIIKSSTEKTQVNELEKQPHSATTLDTQLSSESHKVDEQNKDQHQSDKKNKRIIEPVSSEGKSAEKKTDQQPMGKGDVVEVESEKQLLNKRAFPGSTDKDVLPENFVVKKLETEDSPITKSTCPKSPQQKKPTGPMSALIEIIGETLMSKEGGIAIETLAGVKIFLLYFSATYCGPCQNFTPILEEFYEMMNEDRKDIEIIFVSHDRTEEEMMEYYKKMPWLYIPFSDEKTTTLRSRYEIKGIPVLMALKPTGELVTKDARMHVCTKGESALKFWLK